METGRTDNGGRGTFMKKWFSVAAVLVFSMSIVFAGGARAENLVRIGCSISLTGTLANEGRLARDGYEFYKTLINKKGGLSIGGKKYKVDIKYYDDESNVQTSTKLIEKLITEDKIDFILGPYGSGPSFATSAIAEKYKKVMMLPMAASTSIFERGFKYIFGTLATTDMYFLDVVPMAAKLNPKPKTVAVLWKNDLANKSLADPLPRLCKESGLQLIYNEKLTAAASDFSSELTVVKSKNPDIFFLLTQLDQFVIAVKQMKDIKFRPKMLVNGIAPPQPGFVAALKKDGEYAVAPAYWDKTSKYKDGLFGDSRKYVADFKKAFGYDPGYHNAGASAGVQVLGIALEKAGSLDTEKVRSALVAMNVDTFWGNIQFDGTGKIKENKMFVGQVQNGVFTPVYPAVKGGAKIVYPTPAWQ